MKDNNKLLKVFLILIISFSMLTPYYKVNAASYDAFITGNAVRLRKNPTTKNSDILDSLNVNDKVYVIDSNIISGDGCSEGWLKVRYNNKEGYVCAKYVSQNSLSDKYDRPWNSPYKAIVGGAKWIANGYISAGQYNSYLKKFNVNPNGQYAVYNHQYQDNIAAPSSESLKSSQAYEKNGLLDQGTNSFPFVFTIPVYDNMADKYDSPDGKRANLTTSTVIDSSFEQMISNFPESYKPYLRELHVEHPNWVFKALETHLDFESSAQIERTIGSIQKEAYRYKDSNGNYVESETNWYRPNIEATRYYMDPRNWLNESFVFQFEDLTYNEVFNETIVQSILNKKSIISGYDAISNRTYASIFVEAGKIANVNPVYLASLSTQEIGSDNISGAQFEYEGVTYNGLYNFYNIGASSSASSPTKAGLVYASGNICTLCSNSNNVSSSNSNSSTNTQTSSIPRVTTPTYGNISNIGSIKNNYVTGIDLNTSISSLKSKDNNISYNTDGVIKTGTLISTGNASYYAVLYGDVSGDGKINSADLLKVRQHLLGKSSLSGPYLEAAKVSGDKVNSASLLKIRQHLLGKTIISQK